MKREPSLRIREKVFIMYIVYMYIVYAMYAVYRSLPPVARGGGPESLPRNPPIPLGGA